jgi:hypothetical protein
MSLLSRVVQRPRLVLRNFAGQECCGSGRLISRHLNKSEGWGVVGDIGVRLRWLLWQPRSRDECM